MEDVFVGARLLIGRRRFAYSFDPRLGKPSDIVARLSKPSERSIRLTGAKLLANGRWKACSSRPMEGLFQLANGRCVSRGTLVDRSPPVRMLLRSSAWKAERAKHTTNRCEAIGQWKMEGLFQSANGRLVPVGQWKVCSNWPMEDVLAGARWLIRCRRFAYSFDPRLGKPSN